MNDLQEKQRISLLLDVYGGLLTERQRDFLNLHYNEDLSYGEIAESENISRQAVHDTIQHGRKSLFKFEDQLGVMSKKSEDSSEKINLDEIRKQLKEIASLLKDDIIYNVNPFRKKIKKLQELLDIDKN